MTNIKKYVALLGLFMCQFELAGFSQFIAIAPLEGSEKEVSSCVNVLKKNDYKVCYVLAKDANQMKLLQQLLPEAGSKVSIITNASFYNQLLSQKKHPVAIGVYNQQGEEKYVVGSKELTTNFLATIDTIMKEDRTLVDYFMETNRLNDDDFAVFYKLHGIVNRHKAGTTYEYNSNDNDAIYNKICSYLGVTELEQQAAASEKHNSFRIAGMSLSKSGDINIVVTYNESRFRKQSPSNEKVAIVQFDSNNSLQQFFPVAYTQQPSESYTYHLYQDSSLLIVAQNLEAKEVQIHHFKYDTYAYSPVGPLAIENNQINRGIRAPNTLYDIWLSYPYIVNSFDQKVYDITQQSFVDIIDKKEYQQLVHGMLQNGVDNDELLQRYSVTGVHKSGTSLAVLYRLEGTNYLKLMDNEGNEEKLIVLDEVFPAEGNKPTYSFIPDKQLLVQRYTDNKNVKSKTIKLAMVL